MARRAAVLLGAALSMLAATGAVGADEPGPLAVTKSVLSRSNEIVKGPGDRKDKLARLSELLRGYLDTDALAQLAAGKHLEGRSPAEAQEFRRLFHEFFVRTYVQRLLLFDAPEFGYKGEVVNGDDAKVATEIVMPGDRFAVDYTLRRGPDGWRATDITVEGVSLAQNFRAQFDAAVAKGSFQGLLDKLRAKVDGAA
jgi:phospholipid transport system substrate-binding protein